MYQEIEHSDEPELSPISETDFSGFGTGDFDLLYTNLETISEIEWEASLNLSGSGHLLAGAEVEALARYGADLNGQDWEDMFQDTYQIEDRRRSVGELVYRYQGFAIGDTMAQAIVTESDTRLSAERQYNTL